MSQKKLLGIFIPVIVVLLVVIVFLASKRNVAVDLNTSEAAGYCENQLDRDVAYINRVCGNRGSTACHEAGGAWADARYNACKETSLPFQWET